jgi:hypothetical protein
MGRKELFVELAGDLVEIDDKIIKSTSSEKNPDDYFIMRKRGLIRNPEYRKFMGGRSTIYEHIWSNLVRKKMYNDRYHIKENYYDKGFLAYASTYNHIAEECYMDKNTVIDYIESFKRLGIIRTEKLGPEPTKRDKLGRIIDRRKTVFILGTWQKETKEGKTHVKERYYIDDVFYK